MDSGLQKWVIVSYAALAVLLGFLSLHGMGVLISKYDLETRIREVDMVARMVSILLGAVLFFVLYKHQKVNEFTNEVVTELSRVTWPTQKETTAGTIVVIIMVLISGLILGLLDYVWTALIQKIL